MAGTRTSLGRLYYIPCPREECHACGRRDRVLVAIGPFGLAGVSCSRYGFIAIPRRAPTDEERADEEPHAPRRGVYATPRRRNGPSTVRLMTVLRADVEPAEKDDEKDEEDDNEV